MRVRSIHMIPLLALSAFALTGMAPDDEFAIKRTPKVGALVKYTSVIEYDVNGGQGSISASVSEKVTAVDKEGGYTVEQAQLDASGTYKQEKVEMPTPKPTTLIYKANGVVSTIKGDLIDGDAYRMELLGSIVDPGKKIAVDDEWTADIKGDKSIGTVDIRAEYKLVSQEKVGQIDTIKIKGTLKETSGDRPAMNEFTEWLSKDDGSMVQMDAKWTNAPFPGVSYPVTATIKMQRVAS